VKKLFELIYLYAGLTTGFLIAGSATLTGHHSHAIAILIGWGFAISLILLAVVTVSAVAYPHTERGKRQ
jgi:hypothetical protein